jgi:glycyl-tRNA synthetase
MTNQPLDFQSIIFTLQNFWAQKGCLIWQPYYSQVGAGTMNPATVLRVLGPEPWNVGYVEPSIRPDDGRYGENPNRLQQHYQFQVILKPDPGNPQELYLQSLEALGIDPRRHDIRFVEDNWESPALGAWGLGWEVWLDGQEITQFTYFQQAGGMPTNPVAVEITYGLERIAIPLQRVRSFRDIRWSPERTYGEVNLQGEQEHSRYYFDVANVERVREMYKLYEAEAETALAQNLVLPAHDYILKCSHTFNILDARGAIGVTERQAFFARMRDLSRRVAEEYVAGREAQGYPFLVKAAGEALPVQSSLRAPAASGEISTEPADFLFEIGTEELPAADLESALQQMQERVPALLDDLRLPHGPVHIFGTHRRLVAFVEGLAARQPDQEIVHKGPPTSRAFDAEGKPTRAAEGFARSRGLAVSALEDREIDGGRYLVARVFQAGRPALEVLAEALPGLIAALRFDKTMRWNSSNVAFSRPIRWLLALMGRQPVSFEYAGLISGTQTRGLRFVAPAQLEVTDTAAYFAALRGQGILVDPVERKNEISAQVLRLMEGAGAVQRMDEGLLAEVTQLVEAPTALLGKFAADSLRLPADVLVSVMKKHQRYFPLWAKDGTLLPNFIAVRNGDDQHLDVVTDGNEQVIRARFADAAFFIDEDTQQPLEAYLPRLNTLTFQFKLGSMLDKTQRIQQLVEKLISQVGLDAAETAVTRRAALLCKADLVTHMVVEMTALQGIMGRYYALHSGETPETAQAIFEHYLPRFAGDAQPRSKAGLAIGLADRLDSLGGLFAAGLAPSGTKDPFAQRRAAIGLVQDLIGWNLHFDLRHGLELAAEGLPVAASPESQSACLEFITGRLRSVLIDQGYRYDVVDAVLAVQQLDPAGSHAAIRELSEWVKRPDWSAVLQAYARCVRITRDQKEGFSILPSALVDPAEQDLYGAVHTAESAERQPGSIADFFAVFLPIIPVINRFFEAVLVMAEDPQVRANRLGLLQCIAGLTHGVVDLSKLEGF